MTITLAHEFVVIECCRKGCGIVWAQTRDFDRARVNDHELFYCPRGHHQHYTGRSDAQKLKDAQAREVALRDQLSAAIRDREQSNQQLIRERARYAAGICPCCTRTFAELRNHMATKHPDYDVNRVKAAATGGVVFKCSCGDKFESFRGLRTHQGWHRDKDGDWRWDGPKASEWARHLTVV